MKAISITLIAAFALTHVATAHTWAWFRGDIGVGASPFVSSSSPANNPTAQAAKKRKTGAKRAIAGSKSKAAPHITAR